MSVARICFQVEEAQWFYEDFIRPTDPSLPSMSLRNFCMRIFAHCPLLAPFSAENHMRAFEEFLQYKTRIPVRGAIMLNQEMDSVVLVKGWKKGANWSFPRGKINKDEDDLDCAIREVYEETGLDLRAAGLVPPNDQVKYIEVTMKGQQLRLYVFRGIPMDTNFQPRTRKEISKIQWYKLSELPAFKKDKKGGHGQNADHKGSEAETAVNNNNNSNKFYMVAPFLVPLKKWVSQQKKLDARAMHNHSLAAYSAQEEAVTEEETATQTEAAVDTDAKPAAAIDTLEGATRELQRLLKIQPPTQGIQQQAPPAEAQNRDAGEALMAILQAQGSKAQVSQGDAMMQKQAAGEHQYFQPHAPMYPYQDGGVPQPSASHPHHDQQYPYAMPRPPPPYQQQPQSNFDFAPNANANAHTQAHQPQSVPFGHARPPPPPAHQHQDHETAEPLMLSRQHYGKDPIPLMHPQPLPPQVQQTLLTRGMFTSPGIPDTATGSLQSKVPPPPQPPPQQQQQHPDQLAGLLASLHTTDRAPPAHDAAAASHGPARDSGYTNLLASLTNSIAAEQKASTQAVAFMPYGQTSQHAMSSSGLTGALGISAAEHRPPPKLTEHSLSLLNAFKSDKPGPTAATVHSMSTLDQHHSMSINQQAQAGPPSGPSSYYGASQSTMQTTSSFLGMQPPAPTRPLASDRHRSTLLDLFKTDGAASAAVSEQRTKLQEPIGPPRQAVTHQQQPADAPKHTATTSQKQPTTAEALRFAAQANGGPIQMNPDLNLPYRAVTLLTRPKQQQPDQSPKQLHDSPKAPSVTSVASSSRVPQPPIAPPSKAATGLLASQQPGFKPQPAASHTAPTSSPYGMLYGASAREGLPGAVTDPGSNGTTNAFAPGSFLANAGLPTSLPPASASSEHRQKLLSLFGASSSGSKPLFETTTTSPLDKGKAQDTSASPSIAVGGYSPDIGVLPAAAAPRSRLASLASSTHGDGPGSIIAGGSSSGEVPIARKGSQNNTPISPADRNFLFEYLGSVTK